MKCRGLPICCCNFPVQDVLFGLNNGDLGHWWKFQFSLGLIQNPVAGDGKAVIPHGRREHLRREKRPSRTELYSSWSAQCAGFVTERNSCHGWNLESWIKERGNWHKTFWVWDEIGGGDAECPSLKLTDPVSSEIAQSTFGIEGGCHSDRQCASENAWVRGPGRRIVW